MGSKPRKNAEIIERVRLTIAPEVSAVLTLLAYCSWCHSSGQGKSFGKRWILCNARLTFVRNGLGISSYILLRIRSKVADFSLRSDLADSGWSAVGGQTQSAYVRGGFRDDDTGGGHSVKIAPGARNS